MVFLDRLMKIMGDVPKRGRWGVPKQRLQVVRQARLVRLHGDDVVPAALDNGLDDLGLAAQGVDGHDTAGHIQHAQQFGNGGDLVRFLGRLALPSDQVIGRGPGTDHINRALAQALVV